MSCYGKPDNDPSKQQTEAGRTGQHIKNANSVPPYSTAAGERDRKERK